MSGPDAESLAGRRAAVARHPVQQGIERVDVAPAGAARLAVTVSFLPADGPAAASKRRRPVVAAAQVRIWADDEGRRIPQRQLSVLDVAAPAAAPDTVVLTLSAADPASPALYRLDLTGVADLDPFFAEVTFTTAAVRPPVAEEPPAPVPEPAGAATDYLARDFTSVRALMLDRLRTLMPSWHDTEPADVAHTVVEVLAYAADQLSYFQDAVGTEAYLGTARRRISVRRHARLLDYAMHEGCNARAWVQVTVEGTEPVRLPAGTRVLTRIAGLDRPLLDEAAVADAVAAGAAVFETTAEAVLHPGLEALPLYDWGLAGYALGAGATGAALRGGSDALAEGQVLLLRGAGETTAHAVRLTGVRAGTDPLGDDAKGVPITDLTWHDDDALPAALPVSGGGWALGNIVLADHGHTGPPEPLPPPAPGSGRAHQARLARAGLTWRQNQPPDAGLAAASAVLRQDPARAGAALTVTDGARAWTARPDLLSSDRLAAHLVVEMDDDGTALVRFGDGEHGRAADPDRPTTAVYRVGNGTAGNVGRAALAHVAPPAGAGAPPELSRIVAVANPVPATGGTDPEPVERVRLTAPYAFREQRRCVVEDDFVRVAEAHPQVRRASAAFRWTGSWHTAVVVVDRRGGLPVDDEFRAELLAWFELYRLAGADIDVRGPRQVSAEIAVEVGMAAGHRGDLVLRAVAAAFGGTAFTRRSIGEPLYLSQVVARAAAVPGVAWADVVRFQRSGQRAQGELELGVLSVGPQEVLHLAPGDIALLEAGDAP